MAACFVDSSALTKLYHFEAGSPAVEDLALRSGATMLIPHLAVVEVQSAFEGKVRTAEITPGDAARLRHRFLADIADGVFRVAAVTGIHYEEAGELIARYGAASGLRTLDSIQAAVALNLFRAGAAGSLVTSDKVLGAVAAAEGMPVRDPTVAAP